MQDSISIKETNPKDNLVYYLAVAAACFLTLTFQFLIFSNGFYSLSADEAGHTLEAYEWFKGEGSFFSIWLPFYKVFVGTLFHLLDNLFLLPRILSSVFGILTIISLVFISRQLFNDKITELLTALLAGVFAPLVIFSVIPMMEIIFSFFVLTALGFYLRYLNELSIKDIYISSLFFTISSSVRYEGWVFSLIFFFFLVYHYKKENRITLTNLAAVSFILFFFPLTWIILSVINYGKIFGFLNPVADRYSPGKFITDFRNNLFFQFLRLNTESLNILGLIPVIFLFKKNKRATNYILILFITLLLMALVSILLKAMPSHNYWRVAAAWSLLLLPFTSYWIVSLLNFKEERSGKISFILITVLILFFFSQQTFNFSRSSFMKKEDLNAGILLSSKFEEENNLKVLIGNEDWRYTGIMVASNNPSAFIMNKNDSAKSIIEAGKINSSKIKEENIGLILFKDTTLTGTLDTTFYLQKINSFGEWRLYEVKNK